MNRTSYTLRFTDCRFNRRLAVSGIFDILEDITMRRADKEGFGQNALCEDGLSWIVSDWNARIYKRPCVGDTLWVTAYVQKTGASLLKWQYRITDAENTEVVLASATWGVADLDCGRAVRLPERLKSKIAVDERILIPYAHPGGAVPPTAEKKLSFVFYDGEKDYNGHINNVSSMLRALACVQEERVVAISAAYANEANAGEELTPFVASENGIHKVFLTRADTTVARFFIECEDSVC